jgi:hypothetical protein
MRRGIAIDSGESTVHFPIPRHAVGDSRIGGGQCVGEEIPGSEQSQILPCQLRGIEAGGHKASSPDRAPRLRHRAEASRATSAVSISTDLVLPNGQPGYIGAAMGRIRSARAEQPAYRPCRHRGRA